MTRTVAQLVELLTRHGAELPSFVTPEAQVSALLRELRIRTNSVPDENHEDHRVFTYERDGLGVQVSARYDWDQGRFVVRDWWTYNA